MLLLNQLVRTVAPAEQVITLEDARQQCRLDAWGSPPVHPDDDLVTSYIKAATDELDGIDGWLNRALVTQTWKLTLNYFPARSIRLPLPPLQSVTSIKYDDPDGVEQTLSTDDYDVFTDADPGYIAPAYDKTWPNTRDHFGAVRILYVCGYGDAADVPEIVKNYIRQKVAQSYNIRELTVMRVGTIQETPFMRDNLESIRMRGVRP